MKIRRYTLKENLVSVAIGIAIGVPLSLVSLHCQNKTRFMTGARIPNAWTCHLIADALGTTTDYLICGRKEDGGAS